MPGHDLIVIGASAGGVEALLALAQALPRDIPAAIFIVLHLPAKGPTLMPELLGRAGPLPVLQATHGLPIKHGHIYMAPPDHHLLIAREHMHVVRGPKENGFRPAVDALFRTAAQAYGPRVVGVVLTGMLDDGTAGLLAVKRRDGTVVVQDPHDALFPDMPTSALRYVAVDAVVPLSEIGPLLVRLAHAPIEEGNQAMPPSLEHENDISAMDPQALQTAASQGTPVPFSCPDCGGVLAEYYDGELLRFRCQVGHAYSRESMLATQTGQMDYTLWAAFRSLNERVMLAQRLANDAHRLSDGFGERRFRRLIEQAEAQKEHIRQTLVHEHAPDEQADPLRIG